MAELAEHGIEAAAFALDVLEFSPAGATLPLALRDGLTADSEGACSAAAEAG